MFVFDQGIQTGPMPYGEVKRRWTHGEIGKSSYYWTEGMKDWARMEELFAILPDGSEAGDTTKHMPRVLIVDDDALVREIIKDLMGREEYICETADSVESACSLMEEKGLTYFDAVVTDYEMPGGKGTVLVRWIKMRENALQVLLLTAKDDKEVVKQGLRCGVLDFLDKPLRRKVFMPALQKASEKTQQLREERAAYLELVRSKLSQRGGVVENFMTAIVQRESSVSGLLEKLETVVRYSQELEHKNVEVFPGTRIRAEEAPFQGQVKDLSLLDLLQLLSQSGKSGELRLLDEKRQLVGRAYLDKGRLVHAVEGAQKGHQALFRLMACRDGQFSFHYEHKAPEQTIFDDTTATLLKVSSELDEKEKVIAA